MAVTELDRATEIGRCEMLMRFDPFRELDRLNEQLFDARRARLMPMDAYRVGDEFRVDFDLPGVDPASIELTVEKNVLTVKAERHWSADSVETVVCERPQGTFTRDLFLGESLDTEHIEASYENGVLWLRIPVLESAKARRIEVKATPNAAAITTTAT